MFSKKNKESEGKKVITTTQTVKHTSYSTTRTVQHQTRSVSMFVSGDDRVPSTPALGSLQYLPITHPSSSSSIGNNLSHDAKPINVNYQSPYRQSPLYRSFQHAPNTSPRTNIVRPYETATAYPSSPVVNVPPSLSPGKIVVKKTKEFHDNSNAFIPTYQTHSKHRGEVLVINNIMFKDKGERHGAKLDDENLKSLFKQMGFHVVVERDLKRKGMIMKVENFSKSSALKNSDISIVVIMSHGTKNTTLGGTEVFGLDEEGVLTEELIACFNETDCKYMANKPKIFLFQCCRGDNEQFTESDAKPIQKKTALTNALIAYSALPGFLSHRDPKTGTWFIRTLCEVFSQHAHEYHVEDLLKMVDVKLNQIMKSVKQTTHYENRGFKRCYLHPV